MATGQVVTATAGTPGDNQTLLSAQAQHVRQAIQTLRASTARARVLRPPSTAKARGHRAQAAAPAAGSRPRLQSVVARL